MREKVTINAKNLLCEIIRKEFGHSDTLNIDDLSFYISKYDVNILIDIHNALTKEDEQNIVISIEQKKYIENWCVSNSEKVKSAYNEYMLDNIVWLEEDYLIFETIFKYQKYFKFNLDEELLLNMIWLSRYMEDMNLDL